MTNPKTPVRTVGAKQWQAPKVVVLAARDAENGPNNVVSDGPFSGGS